MKKTIIVFVISALLLASLAFWALKGRISGNIQEWLMSGGVLLLVGFAVFIGAARIRSHSLREPAEDELSKKVMTKATSLAYYVSLFFWLFIMYISDRTAMAAHTLIGAGIMGMAVIFLFCWLGIKAAGMKNE
jgi:hypothetical protein